MMATKSDTHSTLRLRRLGIETHQEAVVYMRDDCPVCRSEGFAAQSRIQVIASQNSIVATLCVVRTDLAMPCLLAHDEAGLSEAAWKRLSAVDGEVAKFSHPRPVESLSHVRKKIYGGVLDDLEILEVIQDVVDGRYADVHLASFLSASAGGRMTVDETVGLTRAMIKVGEQLSWDRSPVVDKHCVGGLPGNRTTPIVVSIVTACGLVMPKTSSRAITSPAGTADTMETLAPVDLSLTQIREVVRKVGGCIAWGGSVRLSPADDMLIRIERALDLDSTSQLVASVLSKKAAAGSSHVVIDIPVGLTAKLRTQESADELEAMLLAVAEPIGLELSVLHTDGRQPVGRGIGPALEARDVLAVLQNKPNAPADLRARAALLAGCLLETAGVAEPKTGAQMAEEVIADGRAWQKFQAICAAQGGMRTPPTAPFQHEVTTTRAGVVQSIDNRKLAMVAKLAGAPDALASGLEFLVPIGTPVERGQPLFILHAETPGELEYALEYVEQQPNIIALEEL
ncbi:MAG: thymidine phosphorylase family protein [Bradymonadaceae bacterium]